MLNDHHEFCDSRAPGACDRCTCEAPASPGRRGTLLGLLLGAAGALLWPGRAWAKKVAVALAKLPRLAKVGGYMVVKIKGRPILLIRDSKTSVRAIHPICSHQKTQVIYDHGSRKIVCPNHGSRFELSGKVLNGPAKKPLSPVYPARLDKANKRIIITL